jgi:hypothetical protein
MSGLSMRTRLTTVAVSAAVVAPFALMGGSANAVEAPVVGNVGTPVDGLLNGVLGTATGQAGGLLGGTGLDPVSTVTAAAANPTSVVDSTLGDVLGTDVLSTVTNVADLENLLGTVTNLVDVGKIIKTVTDLVGNVTDALNLDDLLQLPVKILNPSKGEVAGASKTKTTKAKPAKETVEAGALPHTGGNADLTAMLLCAGLAVAGTGVTLVTRRRNALLGI